MFELSPHFPHNRNIEFLCSKSLQIRLQRMRQLIRRNTRGNIKGERRPPFGR